MANAQMGLIDDIRKGTDWLNVPRRDLASQVNNMDAEISEAINTGPGELNSPQYPAPPPNLSIATPRPSIIPIPVTPHDNIRVRIYNSFGNFGPGPNGPIVVVAVRCLMADNSTKQVVLTFIPTSDRLKNEAAITIPQGAISILSISAYSTATNLYIGQCFVRCDLVSSSAFADQANTSNLSLGEGVSIQTETLQAGYISSGKSLRLGDINDPLSGQGFVKTVGANPAVGADFAISMPAATCWKIIAVVAKLTTSAAAPMRRPRLFIGVLTSLTPVHGSDAPLFMSYANNQQGQNTIITYLWSNNTVYLLSNFASEGNGINVSLTPLPDNLIVLSDLNAPFYIASITNLIDPGGDQWTAVQATVEEWIVPQQ